MAPCRILRQVLIIQRSSRAKGNEPGGNSPLHHSRGRGLSHLRHAIRFVWEKEKKKGDDRIALCGNCGGVSWSSKSLPPALLQLLTIRGCWLQSPSTLRVTFPQIHICITFPSLLYDCGNEKGKKGEWESFFPHLKLTTPLTREQYCC